MKDELNKTVSAKETAKLLGISSKEVDSLIRDELLKEVSPGNFLASDVARLTVNKAPSVAEEATQVGVQLQRQIAASLGLVRKIVSVAIAGLIGYATLVSAFVVLYSRNATAVASWVAQKNPNIVQALLQPIGKTALGIVKITQPAIYKQAAQEIIINPNDVLTVGKSGTITPTGPLVIPSSSFLQIVTTGVVKNLNSEFLQGKIPGTTLGNIAIIGTVSGLADNAVTTATITDGAVTNAKLSQITDANKVAGSAIELKSGGGLTHGSGLTLLTSCSDTQVLEWNASSGAWECATGTGGAGAGITAIREAGATIVNIPTSIDFDGTDFAVTESPAGVGVINVDYLNSGITRSGQNESITGSWSFPGGLTLATQTFGSHTITDSGALAVSSTTNNAVTIDSGTTGNVNLGTGANAKAITIGNNTAGTTLALTGGATWSISSAGTFSTTGNVSTTGTGTITSAGLLTASNGLTQTTGAINLTSTSGALALSGLGVSSINTGSNALTITSSNLNTTVTGINTTAIGATTPSTGAFTTLSSTGTTNLGQGTGTITLNSAGALNFTGASASTWNLGGNTLTLNSSNINIDSSGVVTFAGGQTQDLTTAAGTSPSALTARPGNNTTNSGTGKLLTLSGGNESGTTSTGGGLTLTAGSGTSTNGVITIGATNTSALTLGATGITTTNTGALTSTQTLTASNGLTVTTGAVSLTGTSGVLSLTGLGASSINTGSNALTLTASNINTTATGINNTVIGATTPAAGTFTTVTGTSLVMGTNTSGFILVADGSKYNPVALSGDATIANSGGLTLNYAGGQIANGSQNGFLSSTDWTTFNSKQVALGFTPENVANKSTDTGLGTSDTLYPTQNAVRAYVAANATGLTWQNPVELINVIADQTLPPGTPVANDGYIINSGGTPAVDWGAGLAAGDLVQYQSGNWVKIKSLVSGDRFGVAFKSSTTPSGSMTGKKNYVASVSGGSPGAYTFTFTAPTNNNALYVQNANAFYHDVAFVYSSSLTQWVQLSAGASFTFASGLNTSGTTISLGALTSDWTQSGAFDINTAGDISINGADLKTTSVGTATLFNTNATTLNIGGAATTIGLGAAGATVTGGGALTIKSGTGTALTLDSGTTGGVSIGTGANAKAVTIGSSTVGTTLALTGGATWNISTAGTLSTTGNLATTGSGTVTSAGLLTGSNGLTLTTGAINLTGTSGALALSGLSASSIDTGSNAFTITSSNFNTTATGINSTAIGTDTPSTGKFTSLTSTGTSNIGSGTGVVTVNSSGALNLTAASPSTFTLGANALTLVSSNFNVSSAGVVTLAGGQTADITTLAGTSPTALVFQPGNNTTNSGTGSALTLRGGNNSGTTSVGGNLVLTAGTGTSTNGTITVGTTNTSAITIGATGITTTNTGALTSTQTVTASNGLTLTTGALNLTATSGGLTLSGLGASSINTGANDITFTSGHFNTTATGINGTVIGATTAAAGTFTSLNDSGLSINSIVYTDGSKNFTSTAPTTGTLAFWNRAGTTLSPGTAGDAITTSGNISATGTGTITSAGLLTASNGLTLTSGALNLTSTSGALAVTGLGASTISTTSNGLTLSTVTSGTLAVTSAGALNLTGALASTWTLGAHALTLTTSNFNVSSAGLVTLNGGLTTDLTTPAATALAIDSGTTGALNLGTGSNAKTITIGNNTGATAVNINSGTGNINLQVAGTGTTGNVQIGAGGSGNATPDFLVLDVKSSGSGTTDPSGGTNGAMYYNAASNKFRCYANGSWGTCGQDKIVQSYEQFSFNQAASATTPMEAMIATGNTAETVNDGATEFKVQTSGSFIGCTIQNSAAVTGGSYSVHFRKNGADVSATNYCTLDTTNTRSNTSTIASGTETFSAGDTIGVALVSSTLAPTSLDTRVTFAVQFDSGADLAEQYYTNDSTIEPGDVVSGDSSLYAGVTKSSAAYDQNVLGIISTTPGLTLAEGTGPGRGVPVALSGRVPVKVTTENGSIHVGDYLTTSDNPGVAMKAIKAGAIIGIAMEDYTESDHVKVGLIGVFIKNGTSLGNNVDGINALAQLLSEPTNIISSSTDSNTATSSAELTSGERAVQVNFVKYIADLISNLFQKTVEFFGDVIFHGDVNFEGRPTFNKDTAGFATIKSGDSEAEVRFDKEYANEPIVTLSLNIAGDDIDDLPTYVVKDVSKKGFKIKMSKTMSVDLRFSWIALAVSGNTNIQSTGNPTATPTSAPTSTPEPTAVETTQPTETPLETTSPSPTETPTEIPTASPSATP